VGEEPAVTFFLPPEAEADHTLEVEAEVGEVEATQVLDTVRVVKVGVETGALLITTI
jgi:hypothetical protein